MEDYKKKSVVDGDKEIVFSKAIKAGKRIYYLDVKNSLLPKSKVLLNLITLKMKNRKQPKMRTNRLVRMKLK